MLANYHFSDKIISLRKKFKIFLALSRILYYNKSTGALAQLGARHTGSVEATGSSPVCSIFARQSHVKSV